MHNISIFTSCSFFNPFPKAGYLDCFQFFFFGGGEGGFSYKQHCNTNIYNFAVSVDWRYAMTSFQLSKQGLALWVDLCGPFLGAHLLCSWADLLWSYPPSLYFGVAFVRYRLARLALLFLHFSREELPPKGVIRQVIWYLSKWYFKNICWIYIKQRERNWFINKNYILFLLY